MFGNAIDVVYECKYYYHWRGINYSFGDYGLRLSQQPLRVQYQLDNPTQLSEVFSPKECATFETFTRQELWKGIGQNALAVLLLGFLAAFLHYYLQWPIEPILPS